ncbi:type II toxin-antitoxin system prevent-host-death family antitoxin [Actinopolyspora erythraea]|uniref:Antitoxin n=1 Tax=Actinopolyspora erythraea TaxID=414996 RepID=A0A099D3H7_9ACTN|nr:type II toxin-antitoxin system prevent-host-death family antitoxin [Actinopolyspora erythraea]ASU77912.1 type II toxin-antitoxin system prevent-host-death family antitoxin [Actinopolyspora erythraea]KGI79895.1 antitoxin [Actinopolyspora erythraea]
MSEVPIRVLNQETAQVLARVKRGEEIDITERGSIVARLVPATSNPLSEIAESGKLRLPTVEGPMPRPRGSIREDRDSGQLVSEMRDEERY